MDLSKLMSELNSNEIMVLREALANYNQTLTMQMENCTIGETTLHDIQIMYQVRKDICRRITEKLYQHDAPVSTVTCG